MLIMSSRPDSSKSFPSKKIRPWARLGFPGFFILLSLLSLFCLWACRLNDEPGKTILTLKADTAWVKLENLKVILSDTNGQSKDTLFDAKLANVNSLGNLSPKNY